MMTAASTPSAMVTIGQRRREERADRRCRCARWPFRTCGWVAVGGQPSRSSGWPDSVPGHPPGAVRGSSSMTAGCGAVWASICARPAGLSARSSRLRSPAVPCDAAPAMTGAVVGASVVVSVSTTSATMTVMLSGPPPRIASSMSCTVTSSRSGTVLSAWCSVSALTTLDRPSEQSRYRSPGMALRMDRSGSASPRPSSARRISDRCGWVAASSWLSRPSSTSDCTRE